MSDASMGTNNDHEVGLTNGDPGVQKGGKDSSEGELRGCQEGASKGQKQGNKRGATTSTWAKKENES